MKAFWWFKQNSIAGMGRPGFNRAHWFDMPFDEGVLMGWLGKFSSGHKNRALFVEHTRHYAPRIYKFYGLSEATGPKALEIFNTSAGIDAVFTRLAERTRIFENFVITDQQIHFNLSENRIKEEIDYLQSKSVRRIVSLTENHHQKEQLAKYFYVHHIGIEDLNAPEAGQVHELVEVIKEAQKKNEVIAVHCLAGIGRTSTMLMAAHIVLGEKADDLVKLLKIQNPSFTLTGPQGDFLRSFQRS